jgi:hypothetical protein
LYNENNKKAATLIKTRRNDSDITKTNTAETQRADFFGEDVLFRVLFGVTHNRAENNKTTLR